MADRLEGAAFILWINNYTEGWHPTVFGSERDLIAYIQDGVHSPFVITSGAKELRAPKVRVPSLPCPVCDDGIEEECPRCGSGRATPRGQG